MFINLATQPCIKSEKNKGGKNTTRSATCGRTHRTIRHTNNIETAKRYEHRLR